MNRPFLLILFGSTLAVAQAGPFDARAHEIFKQLIEINTTDSVGNVTTAADEEGGRFNGVDWLVKNHRTLIDAAMAINEGGMGQMKGGKYLLNEVQASEKVYQDFRIESTNRGGHSSRPVKDNAIYHVSKGLERLAAFDFPVHMNEVTRAYFERMAAFQTDPTVAAAMRAVARPTPDPQAV